VSLAALGIKVMWSVVSGCQLVRDCHTVAAERVYDRASATYGLVGPYLFGHFGRRLVDQAAAEQDAVVLDVATVWVPKISSIGCDLHVRGRLKAA